MTPKVPTLNLELIEAGALLMLQGLGVDTTDGNFATTPQRVAKVMQELFVPKETEWPVFEEEYTDLCMMRGFEFHTLCPHHLLPVKIEANIAYIPNGKVIGASKLGRMLLESNRMPMTQEALTKCAIDSVDKLTENTSLGAAILFRGEHGCFRVRGLKSNADMVTIKYSGQFLTDELLQQRFLTLIKL